MNPDHVPLHLMPPKLRTWAQALSSGLQVDFDFALVTLLSGMASAVNGLKVVGRPDGGEEVLALSCILLAPPTYGKSRVFKRVHVAHHDADVERHNAHEAALRVPRSRGDRSPFPRLRLSTVADCSRRGLLEEIRGVREATSMSSHEGNQLLRSNLFQQGGLDMLTMLWDGGSVVQQRRGRGDVLVASDATLNFLIMLQNDIFASYLDSKGGRHARDIGWFARCLFVSAPSSSQPLPQDQATGMDCLEAFDNHVSEFLQTKLARQEAEDMNPDALELSPEGRQAYADLTHADEFVVGFQNRHMHDAINRGKQSALRISGIIQMFEDAETEISVSAVLTACDVVRKSLREYARMFPPEMMPIRKIQARPMTAIERRAQREVEDCQRVLEVTAELCRLTQQPEVPRSRVMIRSGLYAARFSTAEMRLVDEGRIQVAGSGTERLMRILAHVPREQWPANWSAVTST